VVGLTKELDVLLGIVFALWLLTGK